jgi:hypothetical protein
VKTDVNVVKLDGDDARGGRGFRAPGIIADEGSE